MAVDIAASSALSRVQAAWLSRLAAMPARSVVAGIVVLSFAVRWLVAFAKAVPLYFNDEYIYSALARSFAESGRPLIRGGPAHFPALLEPLLAAPFWLRGDPELAYRLTQGLHALAMSLAAVPVYALCRRLDLGAGFALAAALFAVVAPDMYYVSWITADPIAYPLVLAAVYFGVRALDERSLRPQLSFVAFSGLATFTRVQYVVVPIAFAAAALIVERGRMRAAIRGQWLALALLALPALGILAIGPQKALGYYSGITRLGFAPGGLLHWIGTDAMLIAYSAGWVLVPGALVGLAYALVRPRSRTESAFAALTAVVAAGVFGEAALYAANGAGRFQERYLMVLIPLVAPAFGVYLRRGRPGRPAIVVIALVLLLVAARVPLSGYTVAEGMQDSAFLFAVSSLQGVLGVGTGGLLVALVAAILSLLAVGLAFRTRLVPAAVGASVLCGIAVSFGAIHLDVHSSRVGREAFLPNGLRWVDAERLGRVSLLQTPASQHTLSSEQLFWNTSIKDLLLLDNASRVDAFRSPRARIAADGTLRVGGRVRRQALLVSNYAVSADLTGARRVATAGAMELWRPQGTPRFSVFGGGFYYDRWLSQAGNIRVWPTASGGRGGTLSLQLWLPRGTRRVTLRFFGPGSGERTVVVDPGERKAIAFRVPAGRLWRIRFKASRPGYLSDGRSVSVKAGRPVFTPR